MKYVLACLLGALVSFAWGYVSWMMLGWHEAGMRSFKDEAAVTTAIRANVTQGRGIYTLPGISRPPSFATQEQKRQAEADHLKAMEEGPFVYAIVRPGRSEFSMGRNLALSFGRSLLACAIIGALMSRAVLGFAGRVAFGGAVGLFAGLVGDAQMWIWFEFPNRDLIVNLADHAIEWCLVGAVLGLFLGRAPTANDAG
jgi:hypothetical protein